MTSRAALAALAGDLRRIGLAAGLDAVGFAPATPFDRARAELERRKDAGLHGGMHFTYSDPARATDPARTLPGAAALVVGARSYLRTPPGLSSPADPTPPAAAGIVARYSWRDHYAPLRAALGAVADRLTGAGWHARVLVDDNGLVDREAAFRAGLGWYGKNANLLLPERGSWFVLGSVITDAPLAPDTGPVEDGCGTCRRCLAWLLEAPGAFPTEHRVALGGRVYGCDDCQDVCPPNRTAARRFPPPPAEPDAEPWIDLVVLLAMTDAELLGHVGRWYIPRRQPRFVRRNALVALGNTAEGRHPPVEATLRRYLAGGDALLRAHAVWAAARLGRQDLLAALAAPGAEHDPDVLAELAAATEPVPG